MKKKFPGVFVALAVGYFGSYARGDWGEGSDIDLIALVVNSSETFERRALTWELTRLPVPAQLLVYTAEEWDRLLKEDGCFVRTVQREAVWILSSHDTLLGREPGGLTIWLRATSLLWKTQGRFCYLAPGHTPDALGHPMMQRMIRNAMNWLVKAR
jgi:hypothetical protein